MLKGFRKLLVASMILANSTIAFADSLPYIGADLGLDYGYRGYWQLIDISQTHTNYNESGVFGNLFVGMSTMLSQNFYLAVEGFGSESSAHTATKTMYTSQGLANARIRLRYSYGVSLIPGFKVTDATLIYFRIGAIRSRFDLHQSIVPSSATSNNSSDKPIGAQVGVGIQTGLGGSWAARAEVNFAAYRSYHAFGNQMKMHNAQFKAGIMYMFC